jgi:hypothetical protein
VLLVEMFAAKEFSAPPDAGPRVPARSVTDALLIRNKTVPSEQLFVAIEKTFPGCVPVIV